MAPKAKAPKSDKNIMVYKHTLEIRRLLDLHDYISEDSTHDTRIQHLNDALSETRKLMKYLEDKVSTELTLAGVTSNIMG